MFTVLLAILGLARSMSSRPTRAVAVFVDNQKHFIMQAHGLYASWNAVKLDRYPIDLLFFTAHGTDLGDDLRCSAYSFHNDKSDCFVVNLFKGIQAGKL